MAYLPLNAASAADKANEAIDRLSKAAADTNDVQQILVSQIALVNTYHQTALAQSSGSFFWALIGAGVGLLLFAAAVAVSLLNGIGMASVVPLISGTVVEVVSGLLFYLYGKTSSQLSDFLSRLDVLQRFLFANSICETLDDEARNTARAALVQEISRAPPEAVPAPGPQRARRSARHAPH